MKRMMYLASVEKKDGYLFFLSGTRVRRNKSIPVKALTFSGKPPSSKFTSAMVMVKNNTAIISGLKISAKRNKLAITINIKLKN